MSVVCSFTIVEKTGIARNQEPIKVGIPFPKGAIKQLELIQLLESDFTQSIHVEQTAAWPDGSSKWILFDFFCSIDAFATKEYKITYSDHPIPHSNKSLSVGNMEHGYLIDTGVVEFQVTNDPKEFLKVLSIKGGALADKTTASLILLDENENPIPALIQKIKRTDLDNSLTSSFELSGSFERTGKQHYIEFKVFMTFYLNSMTAKCVFEVLNKNPAIHPGGTWDLGDPGSVYFSEIRVDVKFKKLDEVSYRLEKEIDWKSLKKDIDLNIYQESSGGINWCGNNHKNRHGIVPLKLKGYKVTNKGEQVSNGNRATPVIHIRSDNRSCIATINKFWQNFPKSFDVDQDTLSLKIFPKQFPDIFELQGGERKTHTFYLNFSDDQTALDCFEYPLIPKLPLSYYVTAKVFPYLTDQSDNSKIGELINAGIDGDNNFFVKREIVDEYGWRNFGDLYADHETVGHKGSQPLVSHYNNQYDPIMGFAIQFIVSGNSAWYELMSDLAKHVTDIDIYNTSMDRDEYNWGLFWHTDHYLDASTSTHRTFSRDHNPESYLDYQKGGGPGDEHCYTTGLMYHYYMTGSDASKQAVLQLCEWMIKYFEGSNTLLERLHKFLTKDIKLIRRLFAGEKVPAYKYSLNRGTGNYINTLLDAYMLTNSNRYLAQVESIIKETTHPKDDIDERDLGNIENAWSYTVFLQALCRYLDIKEELNQLDEKFSYAKDSLLAYAEWMVNHESLYLDKPEVLEHPNLTWVAQEIRKANVLYAAYYYSPDNNQLLLDRADHFYSYCVNKMVLDKSRAFTRLLVLLMQNFGPNNYYLEHASSTIHLHDRAINYGKQPYHSFIKIVQSAFIDLIKRIPTISFKDELHWLGFRSNYFLSLYKRLYATK